MENSTKCNVRTCVEDCMLIAQIELTVSFNPFRTIRFQLVQKLSFFIILLPLGCKTICCCPHVNATSSFQEIFGDTHVPVVLKGKL